MILLLASALLTLESSLQCWAVPLTICGSSFSVWYFGCILYFSVVMLLYWVVLFLHTIWYLLKYWCYSLYHVVNLLLVSVTWSTIHYLGKLLLFSVLTIRWQLLSILLIISLLFSVIGSIVPVFIVGYFHYQFLCCIFYSRAVSILFYYLMPGFRFHFRDVTVVATVYLGQLPVLLLSVLWYLSLLQSLVYLLFV